MEVNVKDKKKFYQRKWFLLVWLVFFPPVGIILLWLVHKTMKKRTKVVLTIVFILWFGMLLNTNDDSNVSNDTKDEEIPQSEQVTEEVSEEEISDEETEDMTLESDAYGWTIHDYEEFNVAISLIADNYLTGYKLPLYNKWQFAKFDEEGRIFAMTDEVTFKNDHEKHIMICVFTLSGEIGDNGLHERVITHFFGTDEKTYFDDGSCDEVFEKITSLAE